jgi:hypothetical protein
MGRKLDAFRGLDSIRPVVLYGFDAPGGRVRIVDSSGKVIATVGQEAFSPPQVEAIGRRKWEAAVAAMSSQARYESHAAVRSPWARKCDTWMSSLHSRAMDSFRKRSAKGGRYFSATSRSTWDAAAIRMVWQLQNRGTRKMKHRDNPWVRWAETCSKNHNRKEKNRACKQQGIAGDRRRAELQMCFVGRASHA